MTPYLVESQKEVEESETNTDKNENEIATESSL